MLCESCKEREATIHLTQVVEGAVTKVHLCEECAAKSGFDIQSPISITDLLMGMGGKEAPGSAPEPGKPCPSCGQKRADFKKSGRLGCPECYLANKDELMSMIKVMHRSEQHVGKIPSRESVRVKATTELSILQQSLDKAVSSEQYEEAARLRDTISALRKQADGSEGELDL